MRAAILTIGSELTSGQTVDTNSAWLSQQLAALGLAVDLHVTVGDDLEAIAREIRRACGLADAVLIAGGLGPTADDLTRAALAAAMGAPLQPDARSLEQIRAYFAQRRRDMPPANESQALIPAGAAAIPNTCGTAPGIRAAIGSARVFAMPGVPHELHVMFDVDVRPVLSAASGGGVILATTLYTYGASEAHVGGLIRDLMARDRNPLVGTTAQETVIGVRVLARGASRAAAESLLEADVSELRRRLGAIVFGRDDAELSTAVAGLLRRQKRTAATAESCTGGLIARNLTDVPGSSACFLEGVVTYSNESKTRLLGVPQELIRRCGAVSREVAESMARGCLARAGSDFAISVTGIAGPDGGTPDKPVGLVYVGLAERAASEPARGAADAGPAAACTVKEYFLGEQLTRWQVRERTARAALNLLRVRLMADERA